LFTNACSRAAGSQFGERPLPLRRGHVHLLAARPRGIPLRGSRSRPMASYLPLGNTRTVARPISPAAPGSPPFASDISAGFLPTHVYSGVAVAVLEPAGPAATGGRIRSRGVTVSRPNPNSEGSGGGRPNPRTDCVANSSVIRSRRWLLFGIVRRQQDVLHLPQGTVQRQRFILGVVQRCPGDRSGLKRPDQGGLVDHRGPGGIDQHRRGRMRARGLCFPDQPQRGRVQVAVC
jgi:hypothetical protein